MEELTQHDQLKTREKQLLVFQECIWHCIHAQDAVKHKICLINGILPLSHKKSQLMLHTSKPFISNLCYQKSYMTNQF